MRATIVLSASLTLTLLACNSEHHPTQPGIGASLLPDAPSLAASSNTWTPKAAPLYGEDFRGYSLGVAPNSAGESIVYAFGGTFPERGGAGSQVTSYNVAADAWTGGRLSEVGVFSSNGVGKVGSRLYFSGGYNEGGTCRPS